MARQAGAGGGSSRSATVVPVGLNQQPAGVTFARQADVPPVVLIARGVLARGILSRDASSRGCEKRAKLPISAISSSAVSVEIPKPRQALHLARPPFAAGDLAGARVERASWRSMPSTWISSCLTTRLRAASCARSS